MPPPVPAENVSRRMMFRNAAAASPTARHPGIVGGPANRPSALTTHAEPGRLPARCLPIAIGISVASAIGPVDPDQGSHDDTSSTSWTTCSGVGTQDAPET